MTGAPSLLLLTPRLPFYAIPPCQDGLLFFWNCQPKQILYSTSCLWSWCFIPQQNWEVTWQGPDAAHQSRSQPKQREMNSYMLLACLVISLLLHLRAPYLGCGRAHKGLGLPVTISEDSPPRHKPTKINSSSLRLSFQQIPGCVKLPTTLRIIIWN